MKRNVRDLLRQGIDPEDIDEILAEDLCRSTPTNAPTATDGKTSARLQRRKKNRAGRVQRAKQREEKFRAQER